MNLRRQRDSWDDSCPVYTTHGSVSRLDLIKRCKALDLGPQGSDTLEEFKAQHPDGLGFGFGQRDELLFAWMLLLDKLCEPESGIGPLLDDLRN